MHAEHADSSGMNELAGQVIGCAFTVLRIRRELIAPRGATVASTSSRRRRACPKRRLGSASASSRCAGSEDVNDRRSPAMTRVASSASGNDSVVSPRAFNTLGARFLKMSMRTRWDMRPCRRPIGCATIRRQGALQRQLGRRVFRGPADQRRASGRLEDHQNGRRTHAAVRLTRGRMRCTNYLKATGLQLCLLLQQAAPGNQTRCPWPMNRAESSACFACIACLHLR
jgi:hypothetical protein